MVLVYSRNIFFGPCLVKERCFNGYGTFRQVYSPTRDTPTREDRSDKYSPTRGQVLPANSLFDIVIFFGGYWASDNIETLHM